MKADPIIAVKDVEKSSLWYQHIFGCTSKHGGAEFDVLVSEEGEIFLCLHKWGAHEHPTMIHPNDTPGNGLILYIRTKQLEAIRQRVREKGYEVEREIQANPNSGQKELSLLDPDGYYLTISEFHTF